MPSKIRTNIKLHHTVLLASLLNLILYHLPLSRFIASHVDASSINGLLIFAASYALVFLLSAFIFYIGLYLLRLFGLAVLAVLFLVNSVALYFMNVYGVIIDKTMIGNIMNTNFDEASSFFSLTLVFYFLLLGVAPAYVVFKFRGQAVSIKAFLMHVALILGLIVSVVYASSANWLWFDKHGKVLGGNILPWSYIINTSRFYYHQSQENKEQIPLPDASIKDDKKSVVVLVIGESARSQNFSLLGYDKNTNPRLANMDDIASFDVNACATYTTAGVKCILEHKDSNQLFEILPNYLDRNGVDVIWRTTNWGEPTVNVKEYQSRKQLEPTCQEKNCDYDEILLSRLSERILASDKSKILIVLHTSTNHGPTYYKKYPPQFERFTPVCTSVELSQCTQEALLNAYDNSVVYTGYLLEVLIERLKQLRTHRTAMLYISDHGESLGENNLYMHGIPASIAPKEQLAIPFIVWSSRGLEALKQNIPMSQHSIFHSVLGFLAIDSPVYNKERDVFKP